MQALPSLLSSSVPPLPFFLVFCVPPLPFPLCLLRRLLLISYQWKTQGFGCLWFDWRIKQWLRNGRSACHYILIQTASGPLLVISIGLQHLFQWSGRFKLFKSGIRVTIYILCVRYWAFVVTQFASWSKYQQRVRATASPFCYKRSLWIFK